MDKKQFLKKINEGLTPMSIYCENQFNIGSLNILYFDNKEKIINRYKIHKVLTYQSGVKNENSEYPTIDIIAEKKQLKNNTVYTIVDVILY